MVHCNIIPKKCNTEIVIIIISFISFHSFILNQNNNNIRTSLISSVKAVKERNYKKSRHLSHRTGDAGGDDLSTFTESHGRVTFLTRC